MNAPQDPRNTRLLQWKLHLYNPGPLRRILANRHEWGVQRNDYLSVPPCLKKFDLMPFGLMYAPSTFQRLMDYMLQAKKFARVYLGDGFEAIINAKIKLRSLNFPSLSLLSSIWAISSPRRRSVLSRRHQYQKKRLNSRASSA